MNIFLLDADPIKATSYLNDAHVKCSQNEVLQLLSGVSELYYGKPIYKLDGWPIAVFESHRALYRGYASQRMFRYALCYWDSCYHSLREHGYNYKPELHRHYRDQFLSTIDSVLDAQGNCHNYIPDKICLYMPENYRRSLLEVPDDDECPRYVDNLEDAVLAYRYYYAADKTVLDNLSFRYRINEPPHWLIPLMRAIRSDIADI